MKRFHVLLAICFAVIIVLIAGVFLFHMFRVSRAAENVIKSGEYTVPQLNTAKGKTPKGGFGSNLPTVAPGGESETVDIVTPESDEASLEALSVDEDTEIDALDEDLGQL